MLFFAQVIACMLAISNGNAGETKINKTTHLVSMIDVKDFGAETLRIGDLSGDGSPDFLFAQSTYGTREITCLTATTIYSDILFSCISE